jgi:hypothetical protein
MKKVIDFKALTVAIQKYADENYEGNFSLAVRSLIAKGLKL